jgi:hypothetical protein
MIIAVITAAIKNKLAFFVSIFLWLLCIIDVELLHWSIRIFSFVVLFYLAERRRSRASASRRVQRLPAKVWSMLVL